MAKADIKGWNHIILLVFTAILFAVNCEDDQPVAVVENSSSIVGIIKPEGVVALIKVFQGVLIDSTFSDTTTGYFEIGNLSAGSYELEISAIGYGKYKKKNLEIRGAVSLGDIMLRKIPGEIAEFIPYQGTKNVSLTAPCGFDFTTLMEHNSVEENFDISPAIRGYFLWEGDDNKSMVRFYPTTSYNAFTTYTFSLSTGARTVDGDSLAFAVSSNFITEPVQVRSTNPEDGATYVNPATAIYFRFNTEMDRLSVQNAFSLEPSVNGHFVWHNNESFSYYPQSNLATNSDYYAEISTNAKDVHGTSIVDLYSIEFTVEPLAVQYTYPADGATEISRSTSIQVGFNTEVLQTSAENAFAMSPSVQGAFSWSDFTRFTFTPEQNLQADTDYTVIISTMCADKYGMQLPQTYQFSFTTAAN
ncbi:hypothetical protein GF337_06680 [candidate division KSB1 bacterium]|nr:hypothetical protein [candidate division KSB1 bacterium]